MPSYLFAVNSKTAETGISASVSGSGAILLSKLDGNDISLKSFTIASGTISARQVDKFGEKVQSSSITIATGKHVISGGQIELRSPVVTTIDLSHEINADTVIDICQQNGILDIAGYRKLGRNQLRIATFPAIELDDIHALTKSLDYVIGHLL